MKIAPFACTALVTALSLVPFQAASTQAQQDEEAVAVEEAAPPEADAADVASVDALIAALYDVISGDAGEARDWDRFVSLFHPELGRLTPLRAADGAWTALSMTPATYAERAEQWTKATAFYEREIARRQETFGGLCHVWSTYEGFNAKDTKTPFLRGINSIQLMNDGERWSILTIAWDAEREDQKLPDEYLKSADDGDGSKGE